MFRASPNAAAVNRVTCLLLQTRLAAVCHGLVEWLKVFEGWLVAFLRIHAEVFVESPVCRAPGWTYRTYSGKDPM